MHENPSMLTRYPLREYSGCDIQSEPALGNDVPFHSIIMVTIICHERLGLLPIILC